ncbi:hypothetical protein B0H21DRAFT_826238 [Amylocystis lapponica]|nr:hypothetical protein B0H21DRAFT_826238 [Amylocystis lapponica]
MANRGERSSSMGSQNQSTDSGRHPQDFTRWSSFSAQPYVGGNGVDYSTTSVGHSSSIYEPFSKSSTSSQGSCFPYDPSRPSHTAYTADTQQSRRGSTTYRSEQAPVRDALDPTVYSLPGLTIAGPPFLHSSLGHHPDTAHPFPVTALAGYDHVASESTSGPRQTWPFTVYERPASSHPPASTAYSLYPPILYTAPVGETPAATYHGSVHRHHCHTHHGRFSPDIPPFVASNPSRSLGNPIALADSRLPPHIPDSRKKRHHRATRAAAVYDTSQRIPCCWNGCTVLLDDTTPGGLKRHLRDFHFFHGPWNDKQREFCLWTEGGAVCEEEMDMASLGKHISAAGFLGST